MNIIFFSRREGRARHFNLGASRCGRRLRDGAGRHSCHRFQPWIQDRREQARPRGVSTWTETLAEQQAEIKELKAELQRRVDAVAMRIGQMNAHVIRLDALGKRLTQMANIDNREFDFESTRPSADRSPTSASRTGAGPQRCCMASKPRFPRVMRSSRRSRTHCFPRSSTSRSGPMAAP